VTTIEVRRPLGSTLTAMRNLFAATLLILGVSPLGLAQDKPKLLELNTILMESTFRLQGPDKAIKGNTSFGTAFLIGKPLPAPSTAAYYVLVTAAHVLDEIEGDTAQLGIPTKKAGGTFELIWRNISIRSNGKDLYVKHGDYATDHRADAAALYVEMPDDRNGPLLGMDFLAGDKILEEFEVHPGDELFCLGFPLYVGTDSGFPILRSGTIASYPLTPTTTYKNLYFDARVFEGNSGGPVYFVDRNRIYNGQAHLGGPIQFVVGLLNGQIGAKFFKDEKISLATVVPSRFIIETIALLPPASPYK
jgi:hypothetical protein